MDLKTTNVFPKPDPTLLLHGLDSLYVSFYGETSTAILDWDDLAHQKTLARETRREFQELNLGSRRFALMPFGRQSYTYVLRNKHFEIRLRERPQPTLHIQFFSEALWHLGVERLVQQVRDWLASLSLQEISPEIVARADWAFDYHLAQVDFDVDCFVSVAVRSSRYPGQWQRGGRLPDRRPRPDPPGL